MGGSQSKSNSFGKINLEEWKVTSDMGDYQIVQNLNANDNLLDEVAEMWVVKLSNKNSRKTEIDLYEFRKQTNFPVVKCLGYKEYEKQSAGLCGSIQTYKIFTERIIARWAEFPQLTFLECLYALKQSLKGYRQLFKTIGSIQVNDRMFGINRQGDIKVWIHQNFGINTPQLQKSIDYSQNGSIVNEPIASEPVMVRSILHIIEQKCEQGKYPDNMRTQMYRFGTSFMLALNFVENYAQKQSLIIPNKIHPNLNFILANGSYDNIPFFGEASITQPYQINKLYEQPKNVELKKVINNTGNFKPTSYRYLPTSTNQNKMILNHQNNQSNQNHQNYQSYQNYQNYRRHPSQIRGAARVVNAKKIDVKKSIEISQAMTPHKKAKNQVFNYFRQHPHIATAQSVYQPLKRNISGNLTPRKSQKEAETESSHKKLNEAGKMVESKYIYRNPSASKLMKNNDLALSQQNKAQYIRQRPVSVSKGQITFNYINTIKN